MNDFKNSNSNDSKGVTDGFKKITMAQCCYETETIKDAIDLFSKKLISTGELVNITRANNLRQYYNLISKKTYVDRMEKIIKTIAKEFLRKDFPDIQSKIELRIKSLLSFDAKLQLLQKEAARDVANGKRPRELFPKDVMAFRIIVLDKKTSKDVDDCYRILNNLLPFLTSNFGCTIMSTTGTIGTKDFEIQNHPEVIFPSQSTEILEEYKLYVKDYISTPKKNGYQALHVVVTDIKLNFSFEIQIQTQTMFYNATQTASHEGHKAMKYADIYDADEALDPKKVNMYGFYYYPESDELYDYIGLIAPRIHRPIPTINI